MPPTFRTCIHVKTNGLRCQSPALRHSVHCYNHHNHRRTLKRHNVIRTLKSRRGRMAALQVVIDGVMNGRMDPEVGRTLMYGIQLGTDMATKHQSATTKLDATSLTSLLRGL